MGEMKGAEDRLIAKLRERQSDPQRYIDIPAAFAHRVYPPVAPSALAEAEHALGFRLPTLLRRIYLEVGNGGFGPGFGILGLNRAGAKNYHLSLVDWYIGAVSFSQPDYPPWPRGYLTICDWGDGNTSIVDWQDHRAPVLRFSGDRYESGPYEQVFEPESPSLQAWLEAWVAESPSCGGGG